MRARASRDRDVPSGEPDGGEKRREPATAGADSGTAFLWVLSCRDKKGPRLRVREPDSNNAAGGGSTKNVDGGLRQKSPNPPYIKLLSKREKENYLAFASYFSITFCVKSIPSSA